MKKLLLCVLLFVAAIVQSAFAADDRTPPDVLVKSVTNDVLGIVRQDKAIQAGDTNRALGLVEERVLPHFNFQRMTMLAVGRDWRTASAAQQGRLVEAFKTLLVRTYSNALTQYRDQVIDFKPVRMSAADTTVQVRTEVRQPGAQAIDIDYTLEKTDAGWKVFDVVVAGVSLVTNYRSSFGAEIRSGGIDGLIRSLESKNESLVGSKDGA